MPPAPAPGKAAEYSPVGPTQVWRSNETARGEGQNGFSGNNSGITPPSPGINSNDRNGVSGDSSNYTTIQKRSDDNSIGSSKTGEENGSTGSSGNTSGN
jgi:hypothetical protein